MKNDTLDAVFSLLPGSQADLAMQHVHERAARNAGTAAFDMRWADFDFTGRFLRGGISNILDLETQTISNSQSDFGIDLLASRAIQGDLSAGLMEWNDRHELLLWYLPFHSSDSTGVINTRLRGLAVNCDLFIEVMELFNDSANLTLAEMRTVFHLVAGLGLRESGQMDGVSYETKRVYIKSAGDKMNCAGQKDLVRKVMGQMYLLMSVSESGLKHAETAASFAENYLHDDMRFMTRHHPSGGILRWLVGGPVNGRPVVLVHGMMFPVILRGVARFLDQHNIRLYVPIRSGYLESRPFSALIDQSHLIENGLREIAFIIEEEGLAPVPVVGNSLGAAIAARFAAVRPDLCSSLILMSPNLALPDENPDKQASAFYQGMHDLKSDKFLFKLVNLEYRKFYSNSEICRHILKTHFSKSPTDLKVMDGFFTGFPVYDMFASTYSSSVVGIAEDFRHVMTDGEFDEKFPTIPLSLIHGEKDPLTSVAEIHEFFQSPRHGGIERIIAGAGHFAPMSHGDEVWRSVVEAISRE